MIPTEEIKTAHAYIGETFEIIAKPNSTIVLKPMHDPLAGWLEAFNLAAAGRDFLDESGNKFDQDEWTW